MKKILGFFIISILLTILFTTCFYNDQSSTYNIEDNKIPQANSTKTSSLQASHTIEYSDTNFDGDFNVQFSDIVDGVITVNIDIDTDKVLKIKSAKGDEVIYYDVDEKRSLKIPLQMGSGIYEISLFINKSGTDYVKLFSSEIKVESSDSNKAFLSSNEVVNFEDSSNIEAITNKLVKGKTDAQAFDEIYNFVVRNFDYDYTKSEELSGKYVPDLDEVLENGNGICYDYSAVTASMLRIAGIPTKLVMGYRSDTDIYHAWNEVLIDGEWKVIDTTWDSVKLSNGEKISKLKDSTMYTVVKYF